MRRLLILLVLCSPAFGYAPISGWCQNGGSTVQVAGQTSTTRVQQSFPNLAQSGIGPSVTVFLTGTATKATIYSDNSGTPLGNPFPCSTNAKYQFFVANGTYDLTIAGTGVSTFTNAAIPGTDPLNVTNTYSDAAFSNSGKTLTQSAAAAAAAGFTLTADVARTGLTSQTLPGFIAFTGNGRFQPASGQNINFAVFPYCPAQQFCYDTSAGGTFTFTTPITGPAYPANFGNICDGTTVNNVSLMEAMVSAFPNIPTSIMTIGGLTQKMGTIMFSQGQPCVISGQWTIPGGPITLDCAGPYGAFQPGGNSPPNLSQNCVVMMKDNAITPLTVTAVAGVNLVSGTYTSGGSITGSASQTCAFTITGTSSSTGTIALTGSNTIAGGTALIVTAGGVLASTPTTAALSNGSATCSGMATISTVANPALTVGSTSTMATGQWFYISGVTGSGFAPQLYQVSVINATTFSLQNLTAAGSYSVSSAKAYPETWVIYIDPANPSAGGASYGTIIRNLTIFGNAGYTNGTNVIMPGSNHSVSCLNYSGAQGSDLDQDLFEDCARTALYVPNTGASGIMPLGRWESVGVVQGPCQDFEGLAGGTNRAIYSEQCNFSQLTDSDGDPYAAVLFRQSTNIEVTLLESEAYGPFLKLDNSTGIHIDRSMGKPYSATPTAPGGIIVKGTDQGLQIDNWLQYNATNCYTYAVVDRAITPTVNVSSGGAGCSGGFPQGRYHPSERTQSLVFGDAGSNPFMSFPGETGTAKIYDSGGGLAINATSYNGSAGPTATFSCNDSSGCTVGNSSGYSFSATGTIAGAVDATLQRTASHTVTLTDGGAGLGKFRVGTITFGSTNSTAAVSGVIGSTCPAITCSIAYTWVSSISADGSTVYFPVWK